MRKLLAMTAKEIEDTLMIDPLSVISVVKDTLKYLDSRLIDHGDRVSFIVHELMCQSGKYSARQIDSLCTMAFFHDIGAYKTEEIDRMMAFETTGVWQHSIYGYLFLKHFAPNAENAEAVLYHHMRYSDAGRSGSTQLEEAMLLHISDRLDMRVQQGNYQPEYFSDGIGSEFSPWAAELMMETMKERDLCARLKNGEYRDIAQQIAVTACSTVAAALDYLLMLVYIIDFKSPATVTHTINTVAFSVLLARLMGLDEEEQSRIFLGALLHDLGKISTPYEILESPDSLSYQEMEIMKQHVSVTYEIIHGNIREDICAIAARHHEKLDGTGYPWGLHAAELTTPQRIVAVADVMSALVGRRSYKGEFSPDKTVGILTQMAKSGKLDDKICRMAIDNYDQIIDGAKLYCQKATANYGQIMGEYSILLEKITGEQI